ncbi:myosin-16-like [Rhopalosiphum padi]|uniref:myosin-16-like n=1 Tax=Rhopalosiphum padi TaxID=40932 RepID=UPI00298EC6D8|nr:myosin-16-like [Rhopalosiphum padi]
MPSLHQAALLVLMLLTVTRDGLAAPDITMSIHGDLAGSGTPSSFTVNQVYTLISNIEFRLRDLSNTLRRDQQTERINSRIDVIFNKLNHLEVSNEMWFDKFQQSVMEECGPNHMTRRLDKAQQQLEITLEHMETTLQTVQNHQKELEKEIKKVVDRQTELSTDIQTMQKDMNSEFEKHDSNQITFRKQIQDTIANLSQQSKITDRSLSTCSCNQDSDSSQIPDTTTNNNKLTTTINNMYNGLKDRSDHISISLKELTENTDKYRRRLDSDRRGVINEFLDSFLEAAIDKITTIQKNSENELEAKFKEHLQLLIDGQNLFMDNCHRLQSNERQIENDMVDILERILDRIDNKSKSESTTLEQIPKTLKTQSSLEEKMFGELSELIKTQSDQVTRTVAYSTNQVLKLHQDLTNISNALMTLNNGGGLNNVTVTTTDMNDRRPMHNIGNSHNSTPSTSKNKPNIDKLSTTMPKQNRSPHD